jgi:hypothetical protein
MAMTPAHAIAIFGVLFVGALIRTFRPGFMRAYFRRDWEKFDRGE